MKTNFKLEHYCLSKLELIELIRFVIYEEYINETYKNCNSTHDQAEVYLNEFGIENFKKK